MAAEQAPNENEYLEFTANLIKDGMLGLWRKRAEPTPVFLNPLAYFNGVHHTLSGVLQCYFDKKNSRLPALDPTVSKWISEIARTLACGVCVATYLKIRNLVISHLPSLHPAHTLRRPRGHEPPAIPIGFAFAVQQLGVVNAAGTMTELIYVPCYPDAGHCCGIPTEANAAWDPYAYERAVECATSLGMVFSAVDLAQKKGTAWWLFRQTFSDGIFELHCPLPEVNFDASMALTHALFLDGHKLNPSRAFVNLDPLGNDDYGSYLREPHLGIHLNCFNAIIYSN